MKNVFDPAEVREIVARIARLTPGSPPLWGTMNVAQMLAHCNVSYELVYDSKHSRPNRLVGFLLRLFVKAAVVGEKPYQHNSRTTPVFLVAAEKDFAAEQARLTSYVTKTQALGAGYFEGRDSHSFGALTTTEWNNMFSKHLDHHLRQFGV